MVEYKQGQAALVVVSLITTVSSTPTTGVAAGSVTASVLKADGTTASVTVTGGNWTEITAGPFAGLGLYTLLVPSGTINVLGVFVVVVVVSGSNPYKDKSKIVANEEADTFARLGAPAGASVSADIASVASLESTISSNVTAVKAKTDNLPASPASTTDVNAVKVKTDNLPASPASTTDVTSAVSGSTSTITGAITTSTSTVTGAVTAAVTSIKGSDGVSNTQLAGSGFDTAQHSLAVVAGQVLPRVLGMLHENSVLDQTTFDVNNNLTAGRLRLYNSKTNADAAEAASPGTYDTGKIAQYSISATYTGTNLQTYEVAKL